MTTVKLVCPACQKQLQVANSHRGKAVCADCGRHLQWFFLRHDQKVGPVPFDQLRQQLSCKLIEAGNMVLQEGTSTWVPAEAVPGLLPMQTKSEPAPVSSASASTQASMLQGGGKPLSVSGKAPRPAQSLSLPPNRFLQVNPEPIPPQAIPLSAASTARATPQTAFPIFNAPTTTRAVMEKNRKKRRVLFVLAVAGSIFLVLLAILVLYIAIPRRPSSIASEPVKGNSLPAVPTDLIPPQPAMRTNVHNYRILARHLSDSWETRRQKALARPDTAQIVAAAQGVVLDLDALSIDDPDLRMIRDEVKGATQNAIAALGKLEQLPPPPGSGELFLTGFVCGIGGRFDLAAEASDRAQNKSDAITAELRNLNSAYRRACSAKLLLKRAAPRYSGTPTLSGVTVDVDESFILDQDDWITLTNTTGHDLRNALVSVYLTGLFEDTKENIHFVPEWSIGQKVYAAYPRGLSVQGMTIGCQTVGLIQSAKVRVSADEGQVAQFTYQYAGAEKQKDVQREFNVIRPHVTAQVRDGAFGNGKVFILYNHTGRTLPAVSVTTPAGTRWYGNFRRDSSFEVGGLQVSRNLYPGERVTVLIQGYELCSFTI
jgi:hypothetical protein